MTDAAAPPPVPPSIRTERLELVSMSVTFMKALLLDDLETASREVGAETPQWVADELKDFVVFRLGQLTRDPSSRQWLGRSMIFTEDDGSRHVVGSIGFHGPPDAEGRLEVGYSVDPPYRRRGFAREAAVAMYDWARDTHGITTFVASVSPDNVASLNLIEEHGYVQVGEQIDEIDGLELVFEMKWPPAED